MVGNASHLREKASQSQDLPLALTEDLIGLDRPRRLQTDTDKVRATITSVVNLHWEVFDPEEVQLLLEPLGKGFRDQLTPELGALARNRSGVAGATALAKSLE